MTLESFVSKQLELLNKEREAEIEETKENYKNLSLKELQQKGICLLKLRLASQSSGLFGRNVASFESFWGGKELPSHTLSSGDIVGIGLSQGEQIEDVVKSGIVTKITASIISIAIDDSQDSDSLDDDVQYRLIKLANDVTYRRLKNALQDLNKNKNSSVYNLIDIFFGDREASQLPDIYQGERQLKFFNSQLDSSQQEAVKFALMQKELAVIHGPPGTGKTTTVVEVILQAVKSGQKVLVCAPSNIAVDNLVERLIDNKIGVIRLGHPARVHKHIHNYSLDAIMFNSEEAELMNDVRKDVNGVLNKMKKMHDKDRRQNLRNELHRLKKELRQRETCSMKRILERADVILATLTSAYVDGPLKHLKEDHFDLVVIDECSQALEAACWIALLRSGKCVLAGDHHQLPPTIISKQAAKDGLELTLLERALKIHGEKIKKMLTVQYRMNAHIMEWASQQMYEGKLCAHSSVEKHLLRDLCGVIDNEDTSIPLLWIDTAGCNMHELDLPDEVSKGNEGEADLAAVHAERLIEAGVKPGDIAIISMYNLQVDLIKSRLSEKYPMIEIRSVDGFQGREKEAVILSLVRSNTKGEVGFLSEDRRLNVAVTRARRHIAVIGNTDTVSQHQFLKSLVDYINSHGEVRSAHTYTDDVDNLEYTSPKYIQQKIDEVVSKKGNLSKDKKKKKKKTEVINNKQELNTSVPRDPENNSSFGNLKKESLLQEIEDFIADLEIPELQFPASLTSFERRLVHEIAEEKGLLHFSQGEGDNRHIVLKKQESVAILDDSSETSDIEGANDKLPENLDENKFKSLELSKPSKTTLEVGTKSKTKEKNQKTMKSKSSKAKKNPLIKSDLENVKDDDFDALLDAVMKEDKKCHFTKCKGSTVTVGQKCEFCNRYFCLSHHIPEVHGCGDEARANARQQLKKDGVKKLTGNTPKPSNPVHRAYLERKLNKKLTDMEQQRKTKKPQK